MMDTRSARALSSSNKPSGSYIKCVPFPEVCSYPVRSGNVVLPLVDGEDAFTRIFGAVDAASRSVWVVLSFFHLDFAFPKGDRSVFALLQAAKDRGVDVRALIWRHEQGNPLFKNSWSGGHAIDWLVANNITVGIRWDSSGYDHRHCHHEKTWIIDAGSDEQVAFCGGIIPSNRWLNSSLHDPSHPGGVGRHDIMLEIRGPSVSDVAHSFVQRWNEAWGRNERYGSYPEGLGGEEHDIDFEEFSSPRESLLEQRGDGSRVQIQRNLRPMGYIHPLCTPGTPHAFAVRDGEGSIRDQYLRAISSARRFIYIENQHFAHTATLGALREAMDRGVEVIAVVPGFVVESWAGRWGGWLARKCLDTTAASCLRTAVRCMRWARPSLGLSTVWDEPFLHALPALRNHPNFTLVGLVTNTVSCVLVENGDGSFSLEHDESASCASAGVPSDIYVHAKLMIVDDCFLTIGSANIVHLSLDKDHSELNASVWDIVIARELREKLFREHLCCSTLPPGEPKSQFDLFRTIARQNASRVAQGEMPLGRVHEMDTGMYASTLYGVATALDVSVGTSSLF